MGVNPGKATNEAANYFAFAKQTNKATDGSTFFFTKHLDGSGYDSDQEIESVKEGGDGQSVGLRYKTMVKADPQLVSIARQNVAARLWDGILGSDSIATAGVASLARHTAVPVSSLAYFTVEQRHADNLERSTANVFTSLTVEGEAGKPWRYTAAMVGGGTMTYRDVASALTPTRETGGPAYFAYGSYVFDAAGSYGADVTKWKVEVSRGVDDAIQTTGLNRDDVIALALDVNVDATLKYTSKDFYRKVIYGGGSTVPVDLATGSLKLQRNVSIATLGEVAVAEINVPLLQWTDAKVNKLDPDGKTVYLDVVGMDIKSATHQIFAVHDNTELAAY
jgi:hypothetical protein